ncbi:MAG TPA: hypothetical protein VKX17_13155 [Planctomycetota bacterium]|nr:hypothetical protein [Planctomycetota bacterium]
MSPSAVAAVDNAAPNRESSPTPENSIWPKLTHAARAALTAVESQLTIYYLKLMTWIVGFLMMIPVAVFMAIVGIYGLILLDRAADIALSTPPNPAWLSPLVRGGVYSFALFVAFGSVLWSIARISKTKA